MARLRHILKWVGLLLSLLIVALWAWSFIDHTIYDLGSRPVALLPNGEAEFALRTIQFGEGEVLFNYDFLPRGSLGMLVVLVDWSWLQVDAEHIGFDLPLWIPFLLFAVPTMYLWWMYLWWADRRCIPPGHCRKCGYNLTGNVSGVCPECGVVVPLQTEGEGHKLGG